MTIREMHYDFKKKFNKIDSQVNRNLLVPEIDWTLNEAEGIFVNLIAEPRLKNLLGFEKFQRTIDDIRSVVISDFPATVTNNIVALPSNYQYYVRGYATLTKGACPQTKGRLYIKQHDDKFEESPFDRSSYEWREINGLFIDTGIKLFTDGTFTVNGVNLSYIRKRAYMHNAQDFPGGTYNSLATGSPLTGSVNCELPEHTHREIVDIAVLLASGEVQTSDFQVKLSKLKLNQIV